MVKQVYIVRHGETDYNVAHRWQGQLQVPLNRNGRQQAKALRDTLTDISFGAVYSSDLIRAFDTAKIIARPHQLSIQPVEGLREIALGAFQGKTRSELRESHPEWLDQWNTDETFAPPSDGAKSESRRMLQERAYDAWQTIVSAADTETILVVTHGGTLRMLLAAIFDDVSYKTRDFDNTSLSVLRQGAGDTWVVDRMNDVSHLSAT